VTTEFENVPAPALAWLAAQRAVAPPAEAVAICQHRAPRRRISRRPACPARRTGRDTASRPARAVHAARLLPGILKTASWATTARARQRGHPRRTGAGLGRPGRVPCVLEKRLPLRH
jgi:5-(carboxyamino)imidazole ribonucleotide synthase